MRRFEEKTVVVTGSAHGIGRASALRFASEGANVAIVDVRIGEGQEVADECSSLGGRSLAYEADVANETQVTDVVSRIASDFGGVDVLHSHAGRLRAGTVGETTLEEWNLTMSVNVTSMFLVVRAISPIMQSRGAGAIVTTGSISGMFGEPALAVYTASAFESTVCVPAGSTLVLIILSLSTTTYQKQTLRRSYCARCPWADKDYLKKWPRPLRSSHRMTLRTSPVKHCLSMADFLPTSKRGQ
jgi:UDP-glucose 4-epimerase